MMYSLDVCKNLHMYLILFFLYSQNDLRRKNVVKTLCGVQPSRYVLDLVFQIKSSMSHEIDFWSN